MLKSDFVYGELKRRIIDGTYSSGVRLVIDQLARDFEVSSITVREAIRRLKDEGMVATRRNVGAHVVGIDRAAFRDEIAAVAYLEGLVASLAIPAMTESDIDAAVHINEQMRRVLSSPNPDPGKVASLNEAFHEAVCRPCPSPRLLALLSAEWKNSRILLESAYLVVPDIGHASVDEHGALLAMIRRGDDLRAIEIEVREHRMRTIDVFEATVRRTSLYGAQTDAGPLNRRPASGQFDANS